MSVAGLDVCPVNRAQGKSFSTWLLFDGNADALKMDGKRQQLFKSLFLRRLS